MSGSLAFRHMKYDGMVLYCTSTSIPKSIHPGYIHAQASSQKTVFSSNEKAKVVFFANPCISALLSSVSPRAEGEGLLC